MLCASAAARVADCKQGKYGTPPHATDGTFDESSFALRCARLRKVVSPRLNDAERAQVYRRDMILFQNETRVVLLISFRSSLQLMSRSLDVACCENHLPFSQTEGQPMRAHWERTLVIATLALAIIVCLWGIKILLVA
jgi:hypothetical protein